MSNDTTAVDLGWLYASAMFQPGCSTEKSPTLMSLGLSVRITGKLGRIGIHTVADVIRADPVVFWSIQGFGAQSRCDVQKAIKRPLRTSGPIPYLLGSAMRNRESHPLRGRVLEFMKGGR